MNKSVAQIIKEVRKNNNLTQSQFAKKFFLTEKAVSNYENGIREPSFDFLLQLCNEFNISLDYFINQKGEKSNPQDLIVVERKGKVALFDSRQSLYLTPFIYDKILVSQTEPHVVLKCGKELNKNKNEIFSGKILYSAIVDNFGTLNEIPDIEFSFNSLFIDGVSVAKNKKDNLCYLVDANGKLLSKGYKNIQHFGGINKNYGLYLACDVNYDNSNIRKVSNLQLIYKDGSEIPLNIESTEDYANGEKLWRTYICKDLNTIEKVTENIEKYGLMIALLAPASIYENNENYFKIIESYNNFSIKEYEKTQNLQYLLSGFEYLIDTLNKYSDYSDIKIHKQKVDETFVEKKYFFSKYNNITKKVEELYKKIDLI